MSSILTNTAAMTALQTLQSTNSMMETTQARVSSGLRITTAADNAAYWSIAETMRSDNAALSTVKDALGLGAATVDVAYTALESVTSVVREIKTKLVAAREPGVDRGKIQAEIGQLQEQLKSIAGSASFSGENWLQIESGATVPPADKEIVSSFTRAPDGSVSVGKIAITIADFVLIDKASAAGSETGLLDEAGGSGSSVLTIDISGVAVTAVNIDTFISEVSAVEDTLIDSTANVGAARNRINLQQDFVGSLMDAIDRGVGQLVDADMTEESSKLKALQVQQQLGIQSLSIANANAQNILALFR